MNIKLNPNVHAIRAILQKKPSTSEQVQEALWSIGRHLPIGNVRVLLHANKRFEWAIIRGKRYWHVKPKEA